MNNKGNRSSKIPQMKETRCIYIPGQPVKNLVPGCDYKIVLGSIREVVFNFDIKNVKTISVEVEKSSSSMDIKDYGVYDLKTKKILLSGKFSFEPRKPYRVHISRFFKGTFVVKANGKIIGKYTPKLIDSTRYGTAPLLWIEPLYIGFSQGNNNTSFMSLMDHHNNKSQQWLNTLPQFNNQFMAPPYSSQMVKNNFVRVCKAPVTEHAIVFVYKTTKTSWQILYGEQSKVSELEKMINQQDFNELIQYIATFGDPSDAASLNGIAFTKDNAHWRKVLNRNIQVKWVKNGYLAITFKGYNPPFGFTHAGLAHDKIKGMSGGIHIRKSERVWLAFKSAHKVSNVAKNATKGLPAAGLVIDFVGDYKTVMLDEQGSRDIMELLGRAGVSTVAAGIGIVAGSIALFAVMKGFAFAGSVTPVGLVLLVGLVVVMAVGATVSYFSSQIKGNIWR